MIQQITNHTQAALGRLYEQFKNATRLRDTIGPIIDQIQDLEDAFFEVLQERSLETAIGEQLDLLGTVIGLARAGRTDDQYRTALKVQIQVNLSQGEPNRILDVVESITDADLLYFEFFPASFAIQIDGTIDDPLVLFDTVRRMKPAGVDFYLTQTFDPPFALSNVLAVGSSGSAIAADTFSGAVNIADVQIGDTLRIYETDVDAGEFEITDILSIVSGTVEVTPATLTFPRSSIEFDFRRNASGAGFSLLRVADSGTVSGVSDNIITSGTAQFITNGVVPNDETNVIATSGPLAGQSLGVFIIDSVDSETQITLLAASLPLGITVDFVIVSPTNSGKLSKVIN